MSSEIKTTSRFRKEAKRLSKKYPSLKSDLFDLENLLNKNPRSGTPLGNNFYKLGLQITSKGRGKSGGARVITYIKCYILKAQSRIFEHLPCNNL